MILGVCLGDRRVGELLALAGHVLGPGRTVPVAHFEATGRIRVPASGRGDDGGRSGCRDDGRADRGLGGAPTGGLDGSGYFGHGWGDGFDNRCYSLYRRGHFLNGGSSHVGFRRVIAED